MAKKLLTLNIGASSVTLAEYEAGGRSLTLLNYGTAALAAPLDAENADVVLPPALLEIVRERGIRPGKVAISISGQMAFPRAAAIPMAGGTEKFDQLVRYEIEQNIPFPIDEMVCDRAILGDTPNGDKSVMVVAAKVDQVEAITSAVSSAGFSPEIVDVAPLAITNVLKAIRPDDECAVLLDIGAKVTSLVIVEGEKIYNRSIPQAGNTITKEIAQILGCTQEEAEQVKRENAYVSMGGVTEDEDETLDRISKACRNVMTRIHAEISRSINFYRSQQGGGTPVRLYLTGGSSLLPQTDEFFRDSLQIEVEYLNPFEVAGVGKALGEASLSDAVLLSANTGVALHAAGRAAIDINLLPPSIVEARAEAAKVPVVAVAAVALVAGLACWFYGAKQTTAKLEEDYAKAEAEATRLGAVTASINAAAGLEDSAWAAATNLASRIARRSAAVDRVMEVRKAISIHPGIWISKWEDRVEVAKVEQPDPRRKGKTREVEVRTTVTVVTLRCWKDVADSFNTYIAAFASAKGVSDEQKDKEPDSGDGAQAGPDKKDGKDKKPGDAKADDKAGADAAKGDASASHGADKTLGEIIADRLMKGGMVESVQQGPSPTYGKGDSLRQYELKIQFKEPEYK